MEYRDLYDKNRNLTGEKIKKGYLVPKGRYYVTVAVWIQNSNNEFLIQVNKKYNKWTTTGGHPKSGESSIDGIVTEIKEELVERITDKDLEDAQKVLKEYKVSKIDLEASKILKNIKLYLYKAKEEELIKIAIRILVKKKREEDRLQLLKKII